MKDLSDFLQTICSKAVPTSTQYEYTTITHTETGTVGIETPTTVTLGYTATIHTTVTVGGYGVGTTIVETLTGNGQTDTVIVQVPTTKYSNATYSQPAITTVTSVETGYNTTLTTVRTVSLNSTTTESPTASTLPSTSSLSFSTNSTSFPTTATSISTTSISSSTTSVSLSTSSASSSTIQTQSATPAPFACDPDGYLIQGQSPGVGLYGVNITNGEVETVVNPIPGYAGINALGYNVLDDFLYGYASNGSIVRISNDGSTEVISSFSYRGINVGDIDGDGQYWFGLNGETWYQVDLKPNSPTYGQLITHGTTTVSTQYIVSDWVYLPGYGEHLYTAVTDHPAAGIVRIMRFSLTTHTWELSHQWPLERDAVFGALYGGSAGIFWGSENISGKIYRFTLDAAPTVVTQGPTSGSNDGARCALNNP